MFIYGAKWSILDNLYGWHKSSSEAELSKEGQAAQAELQKQGHHRWLLRGKPHLTVTYEAAAEVKAWIHSLSPKKTRSRQVPKAKPELARKAVSSTQLELVLPHLFFCHSLPGHSQNNPHSHRLVQPLELSSAILWRNCRLLGTDRQSRSPGCAGGQSDRKCPFKGLDFPVSERS